MGKSIASPSLHQRTLSQRKQVIYFPINCPHRCSEGTLQHKVITHFSLYHFRDIHRFLPNVASNMLFRELTPSPMNTLQNDEGQKWQKTKRNRIFMPHPHIICFVFHSIPITNIYKKYCFLIICHPYTSEVQGYLHLFCSQKHIPHTYQASLLLAEKYSQICRHRMLLHGNGFLIHNVNMI